MAEKKKDVPQRKPQDPRYDDTPRSLQQPGEKHDRNLGNVERQQGAAGRVTDPCQDKRVLYPERYGVECETNEATNTGGNRKKPSQKKNENKEKDKE